MAGAPKSSMAFAVCAFAQLVMPAFNGYWPRWRQVVPTAANRGALCFGPNRGRNVTYTSPRRWLTAFTPVDGQVALAEIVRRYLHAYGPATSRQFGTQIIGPQPTTTGPYASSAIGAGCDLTTMCDIRIASENATFAESFVKVGLIPGDGGAWLLPRVVGMSKAAEMSFTGDTLSAAEALACGLVSRVVPADKLMDEARALAARIGANPGGALRMSKQLLREGQHARLDSLLELSAGLQAIAHKTPYHVEAINAFNEKRKPDFSKF